MKKLKKNEENNMKKIWSKKLEKLLRKENNMVKKRLADQLTLMEEEIRKKGLETSQVKKLFKYTKSRLGISIYPEKDIEIKILEIVKKNKGISKVEDVLKELIKEGLEISVYSFEKKIAEMALRGLIYITHGVITISRPADTPLGRETLQIIRERKRIYVNELADLLMIDKKILHTILNDLMREGLVVMDQDKNEIILV